MIKRLLFSCIQKAVQLTYGRDNNGLNVYMFHRVYDGKTPELDRNISISKESFEAFISSIQESGIQIVSTADIGLYLTNQFACITFDDVYSDAIENAIPFLQKYKIPYTVFITLNLIDSDQYISSDQIVELRKDPLCTIGFHTNKHLLMRQQPYDSICEDVDCSKFEKAFGIEVFEFAFPYGSIFAINREAIRIAKNMKYNNIFSTLSLSINDKTYKKFRYFLPRININDRNFRDYC